jgi:hypothetical protein
LSLLHERYVTHLFTFGDDPAAPVHLKLMLPAVRMHCHPCATPHDLLNYRLTSSIVRCQKNGWDKPTVETVSSD